jgi:hypothetical protein
LILSFAAPSWSEGAVL